MQGGLSEAKEIDVAVYHEIVLVDHVRVAGL